jgi:hypothetical protein
VFKSSQKYALECLRLETECRELAVRTANADLRSHYVRMAGVWSAFADNGALVTGSGNMIH